MKAFETVKELVKAVPRDESGRPPCLRVSRGLFVQFAEEAKDYYEETHGGYLADPKVLGDNLIFDGVLIVPMRGAA